MQSPMQVHDDGKRLGRTPVALAPSNFLKSSHHITLSNDDQTLVDHSIYAVDKGDTAIPLLYLTVRHSGMRFLVDCGATVSIFPKSLQDQMNRPQTSPLLAATYGTREVCLDLGFRRTSCSFRPANVTKLILGLDFLSSERLTIDFNRRTLYAISPYAGGEAGQGIHRNGAVLHIDTPYHDQWSSILSEFPNIMVANFRSPTNKHGVSHYIQPLALLHTCESAVSLTSECLFRISNKLLSLNKMLHNSNNSA